MDENLQDELLRVKARESRYKKEAESIIAELEAALRKAEEKGDAADGRAAQLLEAEAVIAAHKRDLEEAANTEKSLRDQIALILKEAAREKENGDREIGELKKQLSAARQKMSAGEKSAKKEQETLAKTLRGRIGALEKELEETRAAKNAMAASVDAAAAERVKLEKELERACARMVEICNFVVANLHSGKYEASLEDLQKGNIRSVLAAVGDSANTQLNDLKRFSDKFSSVFTLFSRRLNVTGVDVLAFSAPIKSRAISLKIMVDNLYVYCRIFGLAGNYVMDNRSGGEQLVENFDKVATLLGEIKLKNGEIHEGLENLCNKAQPFRDNLLSETGKTVLLDIVKNLEKLNREIVQAIKNNLSKND